MRWKRWCALEASWGRAQSDGKEGPWRKLNAEFRKLERRGRSFSFHIGSQAYYAVRLIHLPDEQLEEAPGATA